MTKVAKKKTSRKKYKRRSSTLLYAYPSHKVCDNFTVHSTGGLNSVYIPTLPIKSILVNLKVSEQVYSNTFYIGGVTCDSLNGYYISFTPEEWCPVIDLTKARHNTILKHITNTYGVFVYRGKSYYSDFGSLYTYPDFVPIVLNIYTSVGNIVIISKADSDNFIKGFQNIVQKGVNRYKSIYGSRYAVKLCCVQNIYMERYDHRLFSDTLLYSTKVSNPIQVVHSEKISYTIANNGSVFPSYAELNSDTSSVNYLHELH